MAFFPIYHYRLYDDPVDRYFGDQLDFFNPWEDFEPSPKTVVIIPKSFRWANANAAHQQPQQQQQRRRPQQPHDHKHRIQLNVAGFDPQTIQTKVENGKVIVEGKQEERQDDGDFNIRQFRKSYPLPEHAGMSDMCDPLDFYVLSLCSRHGSFDILCHTKSYARYRSTNYETRTTPTAC